MVNKVTLIGHLGKDPEVRHLDNGAAIARFSIATNERYKDKNGEIQTLTEWHDVVMWRGLAEGAEKVLHKGKLVYIEGKLSTRKYQDSNGVERRTTEIIANTFQLLERKEGAGSNISNFPTANDEPPISAKAIERDNTFGGESHPSTDMSDDIDNDGLPF